MQAVTPHVARHDAFLYAHDAAYLDHVLDFIAAGSRAGERVLVITTAGRWADIRARLEAAGFDHAREARDRTLIWTDADQFLDRIILDGLVERLRVLSLVRQVLAGSSVPFRLYGDAAGILAEQDDLAGALELEHALNASMPAGAVRMSCGYRPQKWTDDLSDWGVRAVINAHDTSAAEPGAWPGRWPSEDNHRVTRRGERILLWDDHADTRHMYAEALTFSGYQVLPAAGASQALAIAAAYRPDAVVLAVRMPAGGGVAVMRALRERHAFAAPMLALTAHAFPAERQELFDAGFETVLSKPCLPEALVGAVTKALTRRRRPR